MTEEHHRRKHILTKRMKALAAQALTEKIGYLRIEDLPGLSFLDSLPRVSFKAGRILKSKDNLYLVKSGSVIIKHARYDYLVKELSPGALFGSLPLLGQTMIATKAIAGSGGAVLSVMDVEAAKEWVSTDPAKILQILGPKLSSVEDEHYKARFQLADSRVAKLILSLSGEGSDVEGYSQEELGEMLGLYRETVTTSMRVMKSDGLIKIGRRRIAILDKRRLRELSEL